MIICVQLADENGLVFSSWSVYSKDPQTTLVHLLHDIHSGTSLFYLTYWVTRLELDV